MTLLRMAVSEAGTTRVLRLEGCLDFYTADALVRRVRSLTEEEAGCDAVVDLGGIRYLSFEGIAALLHSERLTRGRGGRLTVTGARGQPLDVLQLSGAGDLLVLEPIAV